MNVNSVIFGLIGYYALPCIYIFKKKCRQYCFTSSLIGRPVAKWLFFRLVVEEAILVGVLTDYSFIFRSCDNLHEARDSLIPRPHPQGGKGSGDIGAFSWSCAPSCDCTCSNTNLYVKKSRLLNLQNQESAPMSPDLSSCAWQWQI